MEQTKELDVVRIEPQHLTANDIRAQVNLIQEVMRGVMQSGQHYGKIPGCGDKPTLLKAGAEKLAMTFRLATDIFAEDLSGPDNVRYRVTVKLLARNGAFAGSGAGEASSDEERYKWRKAFDEEFKDTPEDRKREKWMKGYNVPAYKVKQIRTNPADVANTVLKMAKKRAMVDAVLTATAASDIFTQDIEDMDPATVAHDTPKTEVHATAAASKPVPQPATGLEGDTVCFVPSDIRIKEGTGKNNKPYKKGGIVGPDAKTYGTFDEKIIELATKCKQSGLPLTIKYQMDPTGKYYNIVTAESNAAKAGIA